MSLRRRFTKDNLSLLEYGGKEKLKALIVNGIESDRPDIQGEMKAVKRELRETERKIDGLIDALSAMDSVSRDLVNEKLKVLGETKKDLESRSQELESMKEKEVDCDALAGDIMATVTCFEELFLNGTLQEQKEFINLWGGHIDIDPTKRCGTVYMKRFPAPGGATGNSSVGMVAGARSKPASGSPSISVIMIRIPEARHRLHHQEPIHGSPCLFLFPAPFNTAIDTILRYDILFVGYNTRPR